MHTNQSGVDEKVNPFTSGISEYTRVMKTVALRQALDKFGFDVAIGGSRRDEERSRAKERIFSVRESGHRWDPRQQRPELWRTYNPRLGQGQSMRVFPLSDWIELDVWRYIYLHDIPVNPLYFAKDRLVITREQLIMVDDDRYPLLENEKPELRHIRFRTLGCYPLTAAVESSANSVKEIIDEVMEVKLSERATRLIDGDKEDSMEKKSRRIFLMVKPIIRLVTCGSVDDGKSTLIGRLLVETDSIPHDSIASARQMRRSGSTIKVGEIDFSLVTDGLEAEREQGSTIDVEDRAM